jgi:hypothetical protein
MSSYPIRLAILGLALLAGCGDAVPAPQTAPRPPRPALLERPPAEGEVVAHGEASPATHGPYELHGRYRVRFLQYAPEDPRLDFSQQTSFVALLRPAGDLRTRPLRLFRAAAARGDRTLALDGRYELEVAFGDFPYVVRFTPAR